MLTDQEQSCRAGRLLGKGGHTPRNYLRRTLQHVLTSRLATHASNSQAMLSCQRLVQSGPQHGWLAYVVGTMQSVCALRAFSRASQLAITTIWLSVQHPSCSLAITAVLLPGLSCRGEMDETAIFSRNAVRSGRFCVCRHQCAALPTF